MGQGGVPGKQGLQGGQRTLRIGQSVLRLLPVGEEETGLPLRPLIAARPNTARTAPGVQQLPHRRLLPR